MTDIVLHAYLHKENYLSDRMVCIKSSKNYVIYQPDIALPHMHMHDFVELSMVLSGSGIHRSLNGYEECHPGDVYVINQGTPHAYFLNESGKELVVQNVIFDPADILEGELGDSDHPRYCCGLFRKDPMISHVVLSPPYQEEAKRIMDLIEREQVKKQLEWQVSVKAHLLDLLIMCSRHISAPMDRLSDKKAPRLRDRQIAMSVMRTVLERYNDPKLSLESIADSIFISKSHLSYIFQKVTGLTFANYIKNVRLKQACRLLLETDKSNEQICYACGFRDVPTFYRCFQTHVGMTPLTYRKEGGVPINGHEH